MADRPLSPEEVQALDGLLRTMAPADTPPPGLRARTLAAVAADGAASPPRQRARRWTGPRLRWTAGLALAAAATVVAIVLALTAGPPGELELRADLRAPGSSGVAATAEVRLLGIGRAVDFRSTTLPILPKGEYYELWFVSPRDRPGHRDRISAGTFHPDPEGVSDVRLTAAVDPTRYPTLVVTAEPRDGDPRPSGREVLRSSG